MNEEQFETQLQKLILSKEFQQLQRNEQKFHPFEALGISRRELSHSDLLAYLLDPRRPHGYKGHFLRKFVETLQLEAHVVSAPGAPALSAEEFISLDYEKAIVRREYGHIDIVVNLNAAVIGIEVKIDAGEGDSQLEGYQEFLEKSSPARVARMLVFLTPNQSPPRTHRETHKVRCVTMGWRQVARVMATCLQDCQEAQANYFIETTSNHILEDIVGESKTRQLVEKLWRNNDYIDVLQTIIDEKPSLGRIRDEWEGKVETFLTNEGVGYELWAYPGQRGEPRELNTTLWPQTLRITINLHHYEKWPSLRVLILDQDYEKHEQNLKALTTSGSDIFDTSFKQLSGWSSWRKVLREDTDDYPEEARIDNVAFDDDFIEKAFELFRRHVNRLVEAVKNAGYGDA